MDIYILGTSGTFPTKDRNHPAIFMKYQKYGLLFDCGENTQRQFKIMDLSPTDIDYVFITHWHGDHVLGLPGILFSLNNMEYNRRLNIVIPKEYEDNFYQILKGFNIELNFEVNIIYAKSGKIVETEDFEIFGIENKHSIVAYSYYFKEKDKIKLEKEKIKEYGLSIDQIKKLKSGQKINVGRRELDYTYFGYLRKGIKITYITDTIYFDNLVKFAENSNILISESTFFFQPELAKKHYHMDFLEVVELFEKSNSDILLLTHISQRYEKELENIRNKVEKDNIYILKDFDKIIINKNKIFIRDKVYYFDDKSGKILRL